MLVLTNNPLLIEELGARAQERGDEMEFLDGSYIQVLERARDYIHNNYTILTHPLYGSVKPNETVYRSLILKKGRALDFESLQLIEDAIVTAKRFLSDRPVDQWSEEILNDFQVVDLDLIKNAYERI